MYRDSENFHLTLPNYVVDRLVHAVLQAVVSLKQDESTSSDLTPRERLHIREAENTLVNFVNSVIQAEYKEENDATELERFRARERIQQVTGFQYCSYNHFLQAVDVHDELHSDDVIDFEDSKQKVFQILQAAGVLPLNQDSPHNPKEEQIDADK